MLSVNAARLRPQHCDDHAADCRCKGVSSNSLRSDSMIGTTNACSVTVILKVAAGTGTFASNLRLCEGVRLSVSCTLWNEVGGAVSWSCGAAVALASSVSSAMGNAKASVVVRRRLATELKTV